jgi:hypothetical protein
MLYESVNAKISIKKATDWKWYQKDNLIKETYLSWYQSIDKKHLCVYVKFDGGLSIPFARKLRYKKSWAFSKGMVHPFFVKFRKPSLALHGRSLAGFIVVSNPRGYVC